MTERGTLLRWLVERRSYDGADCLLWPFGKLSNGYGSLMHNGHRRTAHSLMCELAHGPAPDGTEAAHNCGVRACCNPNHLRWATGLENAADRLAHGTDARGEKAWQARLTKDQVRRIVALLDTKTDTEIANELGVSASAVGSIAHGCSWSWLTGIQAGTGRGGKRTETPRIGLRAVPADEIERRKSIIRQSNNAAEAARRVGVKRNTLVYFMDRYMPEHEWKAA